MKPSKRIIYLLLTIATCALAAPTAKPAGLPAAPKPAAPAPAKPAAAPSHRSALAEHLARSEASMKALDRHLMAAAQAKVVRAADARILAERAEKLAHRHEHAPLLWTDFVRRVPGAVVVVDNTTYSPVVADQEAEKAAALLGNDLGALWAKRKQVQAERMVLWSKFTFRSIADMELSDQPLYRFELKSAGKPLDDQRLAALQAAIQFVRVADHLAAQAQDAMDVEPQAVFPQWHTLLAAARTQMQDKLLLQALVALDVYKPETEAGKLAADAKQLVGLAQTIVDAERALSGAESAGDDDEADASRGQFQQALADTAGAVAEMDKAVVKAATAWAVTSVPGTKVVVKDLPDLLGAGASAGPVVVLHVKRSEVIGHHAGTPFVEDCPPGTLLVGFELTSAKVKGSHIIKSLRAIYRSPREEVQGQQFGKPSGEFTRIVARPGYAVGAIEGWSGAHHIGGLTFHFIRVNGNIAVPTDAYNGPTFGHPTEGHEVVGENKIVIGIHGTAGSDIDSIGLVTGP